MIYFSFQLLWDWPNCGTWLYESRAHPRPVCAVWLGPFWLHLAGVEVFQSLQSPDRPAGPRSCPKRGAVWGHAAQHAIVDLLMHLAAALHQHTHAHFTPIRSADCSCHKWLIIHKSLGCIRFMLQLVFPLHFIQLLHPNRYTKTPQVYSSSPWPEYDLNPPIRHDSRWQ